jgi:hypothetical protein
VTKYQTASARQKRKESTPMIPARLIIDLIIDPNIDPTGILRNSFRP